MEKQRLKMWFKKYRFSRLLKTSDNEHEKTAVHVPKDV